MGLANISFTMKDGKKLFLSINEAQELYFRLHELFGKDSYPAHPDTPHTYYNWSPYTRYDWYPYQGYTPV